MKFRMGTLDHVHVMVPDRAAAARWYAEHLGFEPVEKYEFWTTEIDGGPLQISADGGQSMLALFEISAGHPGQKQESGIAFSVDADMFANFARSLGETHFDRPLGGALSIEDVVDFDLCWAYNFADPWGNVFELNCYDYETVKRELIDKDRITPTRYWPHELRPDSPADGFAFDPPPHLVCDIFRLEPLGPEHNERDHEAWMSSIDHIHNTVGFEELAWPAPMTLEENLSDMEMHAREFTDRTGFTYSILDGDEVIGCVYIYPPTAGDEKIDARVRSWVRASHASLDADVRARLGEWLRTDWPFDNVRY